MSTMVTEPSPLRGSKLKLRGASVCDTLRKRREVRAYAHASGSTPSSRNLAANISARWRSCWACSLLHNSKFPSVSHHRSRGC